MDIATLEKIASSQYVWAILFIAALFIAYKALKKYISELKSDSIKQQQMIIDLYESHKKESQLREKKLMEHLDRTAKTLDSIEKSISKLELGVEKGFSDVWSHIKRIN